MSSMPGKKSPALLLVATTLGYQAEAFAAAARELGGPLIVASDRCHRLQDPWGDGALPVRFEQPRAAAAAIAAQPWAASLGGILALGDRATVTAALAAARLGLPGHPVAAVAAAGNKFLLRRALRAAGMPTPAFRRYRLAADPHRIAAHVDYPCVVKPLALSASRGVIRADDAGEFVRAFARIRALLARPELRALRAPELEFIQAEAYIPGREFALEGWVHRGRLRVLALFEKPDPLDGPFFEETIYITPARMPAPVRAAIERAVRRAIRAVGLRHGPVHAEVRVAPVAAAPLRPLPRAPRSSPPGAVYVLELAARPIGGLCARALRFVPRRGGGQPCSLESLLIRAALAPRTDLIARYRRESAAAGVMMIPIPRAGVLESVAGVQAARAVPGIADVLITAKLGQRLEPLPEGATYLGFIFARGRTPAQVETALRAAHHRLRLRLSPALPVLAPSS